MHVECPTSSGRDVQRPPAVEERDRKATIGASSPLISRRMLEWLVPAFFTVLLLTQLLLSVRQLSQTYDEANHIHAGYRYWACGDYGFNPEHPPLAKLVAAVPLYFGSFRDPIPQACDKPRTKDIDFELGRRFLYANGDYARTLFGARAAVSIFAAALLVCVWFAARRMFGFAAATLASAMLVFEPNVLAGGALVTTDVPLTFAVLFAVYSFYLYVQRRTAAHALLCGVAVGITLAVKHSGVLIAPILLALAIIEPFLEAKTSNRWRALRLNLATLAAAFAIGGLLLWATYGFRYSARPNASPMHFEAESLQARGFLPTVAVPALMRSRLLPESYLIGLHEVLAESETGREMYLFGRIYETGRWFYFPVAFTIKTTLAFLVLLGIGLSACRFWAAHKKEALFLGLPAAVFMIAGLQSKLNIGFRHLLPVFPFLLLIAAAGTIAWTKRLPWLRYAIVLLIALHAASSLHTFPNYISYANELWGGPSKINRYLTESNVDWGQGLNDARDYMARHPGVPCWVIFPYRVDIGDYGIPCVDVEHPFMHGQAVIPLPSRLEGIFLVSTSRLSLINSPEYGFGLASPFAGATPTAIIGGSSIFVFTGEFDTRVLAGIRQTVVAHQDFENQQIAQAIADAARAVELLPEAGQTHYAYCATLAAGGEFSPATEECNRALTLFKIHPEFNRKNIEQVTGFMQKRGMALGNTTELK